MIPSDHFVRFYNEVFKFLERQPGNELEAYWLAISRHQESHCLELFKSEGLQGMYDYWERIRIEENCDMDIELFDDHLELHMNRCPSLSKAMDNDATPCERYCDHCPGWIKPLVEKAGFHCDYDIIDRRIPRCHVTISAEKLGAKPRQES